MRIAGVYGSAHIKIGQGLLYYEVYERAGRTRRDSWAFYRGDASMWAKNVRICVTRLHNSDAFGERRDYVIGKQIMYFMVGTRYARW